MLGELLKLAPGARNRLSHHEILPHILPLTASAAEKTAAPGVDMFWRIIFAPVSNPMADHSVA
jgi:hypothetical protein